MFRFRVERFRFFDPDLGLRAFRFQAYAIQGFGRFTRLTV